MASNLALHYLPMSHKKDARHIWVKQCNYFAYLIRVDEIWEVDCLVAGILYPPAERLLPV